MLLCALSILFITQHKLLLHESRDYFNDPMTVMERKEMVSLLRTFVDILHENKIEYFIHMGTLIGSIRHHGIIPWDDDIGKFC